MGTASQQSAFQTGHVGLNVGDLDRSKRFYRQVFGFQLMGESQADGRRFAFLGEGDRLVLTLWQQSDGRFEKHRPGLHHLSFQVPSIEQVKQVEQTLRTLDVTFLYNSIVPQAEGLDSGGIYFEDPDGIRLEVFSPTGAGSHAAPVPGAPSCGLF